MIQLYIIYIYIYIFFFMVFPIMVYYQIWNRVPCAIQ